MDKGALMSNTHQGEVKVWDIFVRVFHWSFALLIVMAWLSHEWRGDARVWHQWLGYGALGLAVARIVWGFVGTKFARFGAFLHWPGQYIAYLKDLLAGRERRYLGYNPLGGLMVLALLLVAIGCSVTGYYLTQRGSVLFGLGHRAQEEAHEVLSTLFLILVPLHILGVIWESVRHKENLVKAMITGWKRRD